MAANTLNVLMPSVNNLTARVFVRAAGLDFEEVDVWGQTTTPEFLQKDPAHLTPLLEEDGLPRGSLWESCAIMQYLCNKHGLDQFYPTDPGERAMVDSAMFYLIGTVYPLLARATYPKLGFPQYPGEAATSDADDAIKAQAQQDAEAALAEPLDAYRAFFLDGKTFIGGDTPSIADIRLAASLEFLNAIDYPFPDWAKDVHVRGRVDARRRLLGAGGGRARLRRVGEGLDDRRRGALRAIEQRGVPVAHQAGVLERRAGEFEGERVRIGGGPHVLPVEHVLAELPVPARRGGRQLRVREPLAARGARTRRRRRGCSADRPATSRRRPPARPSSCA